MSAINAPRCSNLPATPNIGFTRTVLITLAGLLVLSIIVIRRIRRAQAAPIGYIRHSHSQVDTKTKPATIVEEELGPDSIKARLTTPLHSNSIPRIANGPSTSTSTLQLGAPAFTMPPAPSVLRPTARPPTPHTGPAATITLAQGRYTGVLLPSSSSSTNGLLPQPVEAWRGIPYAQSTGGGNRFRPPVPLEEAAGDDVAVMADGFGQICPGSIARVGGIGEGEDCLNLNVYRPVGWDRQQQAGSKKKLMPVLIYVHGGAFNGGMGVERDMASFVGWARAPIVGINFNYRVGALGFPSSVAADGEGCLNLGLRDQRALFEWVRENVGAFGGDARRITVMGLSAGAHSIGYHLQSPSSLRDPPFHAAILESGGSTARATLAANHPRTIAQWQEFLRAASIDPLTKNPSEVFSRLRDLPLETILAASNTVFSRYSDPVRWPFQPTIESPSTSGIITALPITRFRAGEFLRIPILTGFNSHEGSVFCNPAIHTPDELLAKFTTMIPALNTHSDLPRLAALYPDPATIPTSPYTRVPAGFGRQWARYEAAYAHYAYICPVIQTAHFYSTAFHRHYLASSSQQSPVIREEEAQPPVWVYHFAAHSRPEFGGLANHGDEAVVVAHDMAAIGGFPGLVRTSDAMHGAWVRFVVSGDPNRPLPPSSSPSSPAPRYWPRFTSPFIGDTLDAPGKLRRRDVVDLGTVMKFGEGNDERCGDRGARDPGTAAQIVRLNEHEVDQCQYWWERVELSEGLGQRLASGDKSRARARL